MCSLNADGSTVRSRVGHTRARLLTHLKSGHTQSLRKQLGILEVSHSTKTVVQMSEKS